MPLALGTERPYCRTGQVRRSKCLAYLSTVSARCQMQLTATHQKTVMSR